jgi:hypothetical protein
VVWKFTRSEVAQMTGFAAKAAGTPAEDNMKKLGIERCSYLEIGCASNLCFNAIIADHKVGVDPSRGGTIRATSDAFFQTNHRTFDVIFVDGLHTYEQVRRDAINGLRWLPVGGFMFFHDMLPNSWAEEAPVSIARAWTGDVWKLGIDLAATSGIAYRTILADQGVGVLCKTAPSPRLPPAPIDDKRNFADFLRSRHQLNVIDFQGYLDFLADTAMPAWSGSPVVSATRRAG